MSTSYLMHHGVKGMKWGVRKERQRQSSKASSTSRFTPRQKKIARNVTIGAGVAAAVIGGAVLYKTLETKGIQKHYMDTGRTAVEKALNKQINEYIDSDIAMWDKISPDRAAEIRSNRSAEFNKYRRKVSNAEIDVAAKKLGQESYEASMKNRKIIRENRRLRKWGSTSPFERPTPARMMFNDPRRHYYGRFNIY